MPASADGTPAGLTIGDEVLQLDMPEQDALKRLHPCELKRLANGWEAGCPGAPIGTVEVKQGRVVSLGVRWPDDAPPSPSAVLLQLSSALGTRTCSSSTLRRMFEGESQVRLVFDCGSVEVSFSTSELGSLVRSGILVKKGP